MNPYIDKEGYLVIVTSLYGGEIEDKTRYKVNTTTGLFEELIN